MIQGIHHVEVCVTEMESALRFYSDYIGLKIIKNTSSFSESCWLQLGSQQLHLTPLPNHTGHEEQHFAIEVENLALYRQKLSRFGIKIIEAREIPGIKRFFVFDPSGNRVEFVEQESKQ